MNKKENAVIISVKALGALMAMAGPLIGKQKTLQKLLPISPCSLMMLTTLTLEMS